MKKGVLLSLFIIIIILTSTTIIAVYVFPGKAFLVTSNPRLCVILCSKTKGSEYWYLYWERINSGSWRPEAANYVVDWMIDLNDDYIRENKMVIWCNIQGIISLGDSGSIRRLFRIVEERVEKGSDREIAEIHIQGLYGALLEVNPDLVRCKYVAQSIDGKQFEHMLANVQIFIPDADLDDIKNLRTEIADAH